jgi:leader peptidase (prepilin peptidase)/N-methyltransferase
VTLDAPADPTLAWTAPVILGLAGLAVGSFLNVVIHRVPAGKSVVTPGSACPECDHPVRPRDNVPVASWLLLRGRCRDCGTAIPVRYPLVEAATGVAFAAIGAWQGWSWSLLPLLYLAAISIALALIDLDVRRLPDAIVLPSYAVLPLLLVLEALATLEWWPLVRALIGGVALFLFYDVLALVYPRQGGMGGGDIKLAGVLGIALAWVGWGALIVGAFAGFLLGGLYSLAAVATGRAGMRSSIPFGPFMLAGAWIGLVAGEAVADWYLRTSGLA